MNFQRANHKLSLLEDFYNCFNEDTRLKRRHGIVEYTTNMKYIHEYLNDDKTKKILDIGAGTGAYSVPLSNEGYEVHAIELVQHNLDILNSKKSNVIARQGNALNGAIEQVMIQQEQQNQQQTGVTPEEANMIDNGQIQQLQQNNQVNQG